MNAYQDHGHKDRAAYLASLADEYGVPLEAVQALADMLGPIEDFDGLVTGLQDYADGV